MDIAEKTPNYLEFNQTFVCMFTGNDRVNEFTMYSSIHYDKFNVVWCSCNINMGFWCGTAYDFVDIPLMCLKSKKDIPKLVKLWKRVYSEYLKYNYVSGDYSFKDPKDNWYEIQDDPTKHRKLRDRMLCNLIEKEWFSENNLKPLNDSDDTYFHKYHKYRFQLNDSCHSMGSYDVCEPYSHNDLIDIHKNLPTVYECLEKNNQLWSSYIKLNPGMKKYIKYLLMMNDAISDYRKKYGDLVYDLHNPEKNIFHGYDGLPSPEIFNVEVESIIKDELNIKYYNKSFSCATEYICMPELSEILSCIRYEETKWNKCYGSIDVDDVI